MKVAVIGAGPAGLSAAYALAGSGVSVDIHEAESTVGGMAKTISLWDHKVDLGPHRFFSSDPFVNGLWLDVAGEDYSVIDRLTRIYYNNKLFYYPLKPANALLNLGIKEAAACSLSYARELFAPTAQDGSFENWVVSRFGNRLFEIFFKTYTEKLWGIPCTQLDADFAAQRIKRLNLLEAVKNAVFSGKDNRHRTLLDQFAYPNDGTGMIYERMAQYVRERGGNVYLNNPVHTAVVEDGRVWGIITEGGDTVPYDHVVSSMPLTLLVNRMSETTPEIRQVCESLYYRNTILVYLLVDSDRLFPDNWIYVHSTGLKMGRISNFRNWAPGLYGSSRYTVIACEYWSNHGDDLDGMSDKDLIDLCVKEIRRTSLVGSSRILDAHVHRVDKSYPVYYRGYKERLSRIYRFLSGYENLSIIGRYGSYKYNNQDHSILMGLLCAENILRGSAQHSLLEINTDYESYQESGLMAKTGLVKASDSM